MYAHVYISGLQPTKFEPWDYGGTLSVTVRMYIYTHNYAYGLMATESLSVISLSSRPTPGDGVNSFTHPLTNGSILDLDVETNARSTGAFVYRVDGKEIVEPTNGRSLSNNAV